MRILYLCADPGIPFWGTKGASIHVRAFARSMEEAGHEVHVVVARQGHSASALPMATSVTEIPQEDEAFYQPPPAATTESAALLYEARQFAQNRAAQDVVNDLMARHDFDLICERYSLFSIAGCESARWHGVPFLLEINAPLIEEAARHRSLVLSPLARAIEDYLFRRADRIIPVSEILADYVRRTCPSARVTVIPNGVDLQKFELAGDGHAFRREWSDGKEGEFVIGFVGSLKPWHGTEILLEAFAAVAARDPRARLVLVGDGPSRGDIETMVRQRNLSDRVTLTGAIPHDTMPDALQGMDVLTAPYPPIDGFYFSPLKIYEYMASGKPIVASKIGQIESILRNDVSAILTPAGDASALASALLRLMDDLSTRERLGREAKRAAFEQHGWSHRIAEYQERVFSELAGSASSQVMA
ncbi:MAG: glycosyltransferase family 4 protein [Candidatus Zixiibacteriota bacterium]